VIEDVIGETDETGKLGFVELFEQEAGKQNT
jgi:hypothetical protein